MTVPPGTCQYLSSPLVEPRALLAAGTARGQHDKCSAYADSLLALHGTAVQLYLRVAAGRPAVSPPPPPSRPQIVCHASLRVRTARREWERGAAGVEQREHRRTGGCRPAHHVSTDRHPAESCHLCPCNLCPCPPHLLPHQPRSRPAWWSQNSGSCDESGVTMWPSVKSCTGSCTSRSYSSCLRDTRRRRVEMDVAWSCTPPPAKERSTAPKARRRPGAAGGGGSR